MSNLKYATLVIAIDYHDAQRYANKCEKRDPESNRLLILESTYVKHYIGTRELNPLCLREWLKPIKNECIIELLLATDEAFRNPNIQEIHIAGSFAVEEEVRNLYVDILKEQGWVVSIKTLSAEFLSLFCTYYLDGMSLKELCKTWEIYNKAFVRQYEPDPTKDSAIVVSDDYEDENGPISLMIDTAENSGLYEVLRWSDYRRYESRAGLTEYLKKADLFWSYMVYHYNIKLIVETDPDSALHWQKIGVPYILIGSNPFALKSDQ